MELILKIEGTTKEIEKITKLKYNRDFYEKSEKKFSKMFGVNLRVFSHNMETGKCIKSVPTHQFQYGYKQY